MTMNKIKTVRTARSFICRGWAEKDGRQWMVAGVYEHRPATKTEAAFLNTALEHCGLLKTWDGVEIQVRWPRPKVKGSK